MTIPRGQFREATVLAVADEIKNFCEHKYLEPSERAAPDISDIYEAQWRDEDLVMIARNVLTRLEEVVLVGAYNGRL
jgi:hypothetical protein